MNKTDVGSPRDSIAGKDFGHKMLLIGTLATEFDIAKHMTREVAEHKKSAKAAGRRRSYVST